MGGFLAREGVEIIVRAFSDHKQFKALADRVGLHGKSVFLTLFF